MMYPFWITLEPQTAPNLFNLGVGVTANPEEDAQQILTAALKDAPPIFNITRIKDMSDLDQEHVAPNMGNWFRRGIWFPAGYEFSN
jgi:hypothetical protein